MGCNKCKKGDCGCNKKALSINDICNPIVCETNSCPEAFDAGCIIYTDESITCNGVEIVATNTTSVAQALANISAYFCAQTTIQDDVLCGEDILVSAGSTIAEAINLITSYFCQSFESITIQSVSSELENTPNGNCNDVVITLSFWSDLAQTQLIATTSYGYTYCNGVDGEDGTNGVDGADAVVGKFSQIDDSVEVLDPSTNTLIGLGVGDLIFPADSLSVGDSYRGKMSGVMTATNTQELFVFLDMNGNSFSSGLIDLETVSSNKWEIDFDFTIRSLGVAAEMFVVFTFKYVPDSASPFIASEGITVNGILTFDSSVLNTLNLRGSWNLDQAGVNSIYSQLFVLNKTY